MKSPVSNLIAGRGFSLVELMVAVAILSVLSATALPRYFNQVQKTRQNEAATNVSQIQTTIASFVNEMGVLPVSWSDLNKITPLMTPEGPANQKNFSAISLAGAGCSNSQEINCYLIDASEQNQIFTLRASSRNNDAAPYNVIACIDLRTGATDLKKGSHQKAAALEQLRCVRPENE